jgi:hypothetical protein
MYYLVCKLYENGSTKSSNVIAKKETYEKIRREAEQTMNEVDEHVSHSRLSLTIYKKVKNGTDRHLAEWSYDGSQWEPARNVVPEEDEGHDDGYEADRLRDHIKYKIADGTYEDREKELVTWLFEELKELRFTVEMMKTDEKNRTERAQTESEQTDWMFTRIKKVDSSLQNLIERIDRTNERVDKLEEHMEEQDNLIQGRVANLEVCLENLRQQVSELEQKQAPEMPLQGEITVDTRNASNADVKVDFSRFTAEEFTKLKDVMEGRKFSMRTLDQISGEKESEECRILESICNKLDNVNRTGEHTEHTEDNESEKTDESTEEASWYWNEVNIPGELHTEEKGKKPDEERQTLQEGHGPGVTLNNWTYEENKPMRYRIFGESGALNSELVVNKTDVNKLPTKSACCHDAIRFESGEGDFGGDKESATQYMTCTACGNPCDIAPRDESDTDND